MKADCRDCMYGNCFVPREDEVSDVGCTLKGFEGYEAPNDPSCFGRRFMPRPLSAEDARVEKLAQELYEACRANSDARHYGLPDWDEEVPEFAFDKRQINKRHYRVMAHTVLCMLDRGTLTS